VCHRTDSRRYRYQKQIGIVIALAVPFPIVPRAQPAHAARRIRDSSLDMVFPLRDRCFKQAFYFCPLHNLSRPLIAF
jgi:hypothetical protein